MVYIETNKRDLEKKTMATPTHFILLCVYAVLNEASR